MPSSTVLEFEGDLVFELRPRCAAGVWYLGRSHDAQGPSHRRPLPLEGICNDDPQRSPPHVRMDAILRRDIVTNTAIIPNLPHLPPRIAGALD
jgi:hypothetical protein